MKENSTENIGGYEQGYRACDCFWGREPGSLVRGLLGHVSSVAGLSVLDAGCGEGKNAIFLARLGARVHAIDICDAAIENAKRAWQDADLVSWEVADICTAPLLAESYNIVIGYGLLHCMKGPVELSAVLQRLQAATVQGGYHVICAFNDRCQDLGGHPGFTPTLLSHNSYLNLYDDWSVLHASDQDLFETHPHNEIPHVHSLTRLLARRKVE